MLADMNNTMDNIYFDDLYTRDSSADAVLKDKVQVLSLIKYNHKDIKLVFRFYMLHGMYKKDKKSFGINSTQFQTFCTDCKLSRDAMNRVGMIFKICNLSERNIWGDKRSVLALHAVRKKREC